jgi:hypothetical protein
VSGRVVQRSSSYLGVHFVRVLADDAEHVVGGQGAVEREEGKRADAEVAHLREATGIRLHDLDHTLHHLAARHLSPRLGCIVDACGVCGVCVCGACGV